MKPTQPSPDSESLGYRLAIGLLVLIAVAKPILIDTLDPDCFWHLRVARDLLHQGIGPLVDDISFNSIRTPWTPYSWLAELGMLGVWNLAGWRGAVAVHATMSATFVLLIAACCRQMQRIARRRGDDDFDGDRTDGSELNVVLAVTAACIWSLAYFSFRPATLAIDLLALAAWLILRDRRLGERSKAIWLIVPLGVLLTNVHLTVILLPLWFAALTAGAIWERLRLAPSPGTPGEGWGEGSVSNCEPYDLRNRTLLSPGAPGEGRNAELARRSSRYTALMCLTALGCLSTPMLTGAMHMVGQYQFQDVMVSSPILAEMRPFYDGAFGKVSLVLVLITLAGCFKNRHRIRSGEWLWLAGMLVFLLRLGRFSPLFAIIGAPMAAAYWPALSDKPLRRGIVATALGVLLAIGSLRVIANFPTNNTSLSQWLNRNIPAANGYPTGAADYVDAHVSPTTGHLINEFNWGGYLGWRLGDRYQTFMDGRTQMHPPAFWRDAYLGDEASRASLIEHVDADVAILPKVGSLFDAPLRRMGWTMVWEDDQSLVMVPPSNVVKLDP